MQCGDCRHVDRSRNSSRQLLARGFVVCAVNVRPPGNLDFYPLRVSHNCPRFERCNPDEQKELNAAIKRYTDFINRRRGK